MKAENGARAAVLAAATVAIAALAGCASTTYGTGTSAGLQTITDFADAAKITGNKQPIDFTPRPPIVAPPTTGALPVPGSGPAGQTLASDWPKDPDAQAADVKAQIAAAQKAGKPITVKPAPGTKFQDTPAVNVDSPDNFKTTAAQDAEVKRLIAEQNAVPLDDKGRPVRQYLSDPPSDYLVHDDKAPAPTTVADATPKKSGIKWPWQWFAKN